MIIDASVKVSECPDCGGMCKRHSTSERKIKDFEGTIVVKISKHWCNNCKKHFSIQPSFIPGPHIRHSRRLVEYILNISTAKEYDSNPRSIKNHLRDKFGINVPYNTIRDMLENNGLLRPSKSNKLENNFNADEFNRRSAFMVTCSV